MPARAVADVRAVRVRRGEQRVRRARAPRGGVRGAAAALVAERALQPLHCLQTYAVPCELLGFVLAAIQVSHKRPKVSILNSYRQQNLKGVRGSTGNIIV